MAYALHWAGLHRGAQTGGTLKGTPAAAPIRGPDRARA